MISCHGKASKGGGGNGDLSKRMVSLKEKGGTHHRRSGSRKVDDQNQGTIDGDRFPKPKRHVGLTLKTGTLRSQKCESCQENHPHLWVPQ